MTDFVFLVGCATATDVTQWYDAPGKREQALESHTTGHVVAPFIAAIVHPETDPANPAPAFGPNDSVIYYGSTTDQGAASWGATVVDTASGTDADDETVSGYLIAVDVPQEDSSIVTYNLFVPLTAVLAAV